MAPLIPIALEIASQFAPGLIKAMTGSDRAADVAGKVVDIAQTVTGTGTPEAAKEVLKADPAKLLEFQQHAADLEIEAERQRYADIASARAMQVAALAQDDVFSKRFVYIFAACWSLFSMAYAVLVTFWTPITPEGKGIAQTVLGFLLGTAVASIFNYLFGSTKGSADKTRLLAQTQQAK